VQFAPSPRQEELETLVAQVERLAAEERERLAKQKVPTPGNVLIYTLQFTPVVGSIDDIPE
jgi:hypothetical protein